MRLDAGHAKKKVQERLLSRNGSTISVPKRGVLEDLFCILLTTVPHLQHVQRRLRDLLDAVVLRLLVEHGLYHRAAPHALVHHFDAESGVPEKNNRVGRPVTEII